MHFSKWVDAGFKWTSEKNDNQETILLKSGTVLQ
jgi:hypothetical protein